MIEEKYVNSSNNYHAQDVAASHEEGGGGETTSVGFVSSMGSPKNNANLDLHMQFQE